MKHKEISSIEWLVEKYTIVCGLGSKELMKEHIDRAREKHKKEIEKSHALGEVTGFGRVNHPKFYDDKTPEQYYAETFGK